MSIVAAPVRPLTIEEWYEHYHEYEGGRCELVRGRAIMTPTEATHNNRVIIRLAVLLDPLLGGLWEPMSNTSVVLADEPVPTIRVPDLAVVRSASVGPDWRMRPTDVALVVEVVSPSSVETDWVTKREEYAAAGIPNYLIVDVRGKDPQVWLFDRLSSGPDGRTTYDDPTGDGTSATLRLPGFDPITIPAADLI